VKQHEPRTDGRETLPSSGTAPLKPTPGLSGPPVRVPGPDEDWSPILKTLRDGNFFATTGEILIPNYAVTGSGAKRMVVADVEWTFPLEFVEVVSGDGNKIDRQIFSATDLPAFGKKHFAIPFDATRKTWVRLAVWDSAGNGAFVQPVWLSR
jgi:hypothetical protein